MRSIALYGLGTIASLGICLGSLVAGNTPLAVAGLLAIIPWAVLTINAWRSHRG